MSECKPFQEPFLNIFSFFLFSLPFHFIDGFLSTSNSPRFSIRCLLEELVTKIVRHHLVIYLQQSFIPTPSSLSLNLSLSFLGPFLPTCACLFEENTRSMAIEEICHPQESKHLALAVCFLNCLIK